VSTTALPPSDSVAPRRAQQWLILVVALISVVITASLGAWQMRRANFKEQLAVQIFERTRLAALENTALNASNFVAANREEATWLNRRATLQGRWLHEHTVFLDNRAMQVAGSQRVGFYVATPLAIEGGNKVIWVQRGWLPRDFQDRSKVPALPEATQTITVQGRLIANVSKAYEMQSATTLSASAPKIAASAPPADNTTGARPSRIWQNVPTVDWGVKALLPMALLQASSELAADSLPNPPQEVLLLRDWAAADTGVAKHYGYAFQWFALSALLSGLYVWFQLIVPRRHATRQ
jgi:surfeit locus 1 family protein